MMTLDEVKLHLRVDHDDEDSLISEYLDTAIYAAANYLNMDYGNLATDPDTPAPIKAAVLLQVADLYVNRERQADKPYYANLTYERLLNPYRVMAV
ncbi:head-tail connector protein [Castellaniella sp.]|uniref:head-tail connector protein n=1 Tax=Castellaniella sp. TaxID=1955812 RepID=UPI002AFE4C04|nr:head-tail connector protein [Castellaniella sp.]